MDSRSVTFAWNVEFSKYSSGDELNTLLWIKSGLSTVGANNFNASALANSFCAGAFASEWLKQNPRQLCSQRTKPSLKPSVEDAQLSFNLRRGALGNRGASTLLAVATLLIRRSAAGHSGVHPRFNQINLIRNVRNP